MTRPTPGPVPRPPGAPATDPTNDATAALDAAREALERLDDAPLGEHPGILDLVHQQLQATLAGMDAL
ncbi:MAG: hypothetical protein JWM48_2798 [Mycobacterium sp.]|jgi:sirohydrochlorin ferrochelatase|nr:hypothetical protein [Mycobacterium sp.]MCW2746248.1 hypothetical protein [Mycobacterium sp.]